MRHYLSAISDIAVKKLKLELSPNALSSLLSSTKEILMNCELRRTFIEDVLPVSAEDKENMRHSVIHQNIIKDIIDSVLQYNLV